MFKKIFQKDQEEEEKENRLIEKRKRLKNAQPQEQFRKPNPCQIAYPEEDVFNFSVIQENQSIKLKTYRFKPTNSEQPKAILIQFHGLNSHSNHGAHIAKAFADAGFCVLAFDHRGFGKSEGIKGFIENLIIHLQDAKQFVSLVESMYGKDIPKFLTGLSMGGMTSYRLTLEEPSRYRGAILMAPALMNMHKALIKSLANIFGTIAPKWQVLEQPKGLVSKNLNIQEYMDNDPYTYNSKMMPGTGKVIYKGMKEAYKTFGQYNCPFIIVQGAYDKLVDPDVGHELYNKALTKDKQLLYYENLWHFVWLEEEIHDIIPKVVDWAIKRI